MELAQANASSVGRIAGADHSTLSIDMYEGPVVVVVRVVDRLPGRDVPTRCRTTLAQVQNRAPGPWRGSISHDTPPGARRALATDQAKKSEVNRLTSDG
jgi:hypothetical protein